MLTWIHGFAMLKDVVKQVRTTELAVPIAIVGLGRFVRRKPLGAAGLAIVLLLGVVASVGPWIAPFDPYEPHVDFRLAPPSRQMLLGGDQLGRDVLSRLIYGSRISLYVGVMSAGIGVSVGAMIGTISGYFGGIVDLLTQRVVDAFMPFPSIILGLAIMGVLGASIENVIFALTVVLIPGSARTIRAQALALGQMEYAVAARAIGGSDFRIVLRHILPNVVPTYIVIATMSIGYTIVAEASLSFLGVGTPPDVPSWGGMASAAIQEELGRAPWLALFPGVVISMVVFGFNLLGDALRDILDPKLRNEG